MTLLLDIARPPTLFDAVAVEAPPVADAPSDPGPATLAELIDATWSELGSGRPAACPVCAEPMAPVYSAAALPVGGRCGGCGSRLA